jgi:hypothetical protein
MPRIRVPRRNNFFATFLMFVEAFLAPRESFRRWMLEAAVHETEVRSRSANSTATARPIPESLPVMRATFPFSFSDPF